MLVKKHFWHNISKHLLNTVLVFSFLVYSFQLEAQEQHARASFLFPKACDSVMPAPAKFTRAILVGESVFMAGILTSLGVIWYGQQDGFGTFKTFNDASEWLQVDKVGHGVTAFHFMQGNTTALQFFGVDQCRATKLSFWNALAFMTTIEVLDGFSPGYGFSFSDFGSNLVGLSAGLYASQLPEDKRWFNLKYSYFPTNYPQLNPKLLGEHYSEQWLKDYNAQTYWMSIIPGNIKGTEFIPKWLGLAAGYGATGMVNATESDQLSRGFDIDRSREYYVGLDLHLEYLFPIDSRAYRIFKVISFTKLPLPGLKVVNGNPEFQWLLGK